MWRNLPLAAIACVAIVTPAYTQTADEAVLIQRAIDRGKLIYAYDQAAWHGTDDMVKRVKHPEERVGGWIVDGPAATLTLIFFDKDAANPQAVYIAQFRDNKLVSRQVLTEKDDRSISPERKRLIAARQAGVAAWQADRTTFSCSNQPTNTVVLPPERPGGPILVYILSPQTSNDAIPFGGHFLVEVGADGKAGKPRAFTRGCANIPLPGKNEKAAAIGVTHLLDPVPTEIHVFSSYAAKMPVVVMVENPKRNFWIENGTIRLMRADEFK